MSEEKKVWWHSKQLWTCFLSFIAILIQERFGYIVSPQLQAYGLLVIFAILRKVTKQPIVLKNHEGLDLPKMIIVFILCSSILAGCAAPLTKACKELTKVHEFFIEAEVVAKAGHEKDPNIVSEDNLIKLEIMTETIERLKVITCELKDLLPKK